MLTLGIDFAVQPRNTAACFIRWGNGKAEARVPELGINDEKLCTLVTEAIIPST
jgi:hypothetical protein